MPSFWRHARAAAPLAGLVVAVAAIAGCGSGAAGGSEARAAASPPAACAQTVMSTLAGVLQRVYAEGVRSERTASAAYLIEHSTPLREAIETDSRSAARAAARELLASGHLTDLDVETPKGKLVSVGGAALAPLHGSILGPAATPIATYTTSVWADDGFSIEGSGIAEGTIAIRAGGRSIGGAAALPPGPLAAQGTLTRGGTVYEYTSIAARTYPAGGARIYLLKPVTAVERLCRTSDADTQVATLARVAHLIYEAEAGPRTMTQVRRVQHNPALLAAVASRDPAATRAAVAALLDQHIVRLRVSAAPPRSGGVGTLLSDVGGPFVLAPVRAELRSHGRRIGSFVLSIQDDEGYLRLARRLAGLDTLMYMRGAGGKMQLVKNSLGTDGHQSLALAAVPANGAYTYDGRSFRVFTVDAEAFPSGPLTIRVLVPEPYS